MKKTHSKVGEILCSFVIASAIMSLCALGLITIVSLGSYIYKPKERTAIRHEVVNDICIKLNIVEEQMCQSEMKIYPSDFCPAIIEMFDDKETTFAKVQLIFGGYQIKLEEVEKTENGEEIFASRYDLDSDEKTDLSFFFYGVYENNHLKNIICNHEVGF